MITRHYWKIGKFGLNKLKQRLWNKMKKENKIFKICNVILNYNIMNIGDSGSGGCCPFCYLDCQWDANGLNDVSHKPDCIFLIAKDLTTNFKIK